VPTGSVLIAKRGGAIALNRVRLLTEPSFMDTNVMALTPGAEIDSEFLYYWLGYRGLWDIADVTSVPQINNKHINPLTIALPDLAEQREIATALQGVDDLIAALERTITKKQAIRKGLMRRLLTGKTRLPGFTHPWATTTLGAIGTFLKGRGVKRDDVRRSGVRCIRYGELYTSFHDYTAEARSFVTPDVASTALPLRSGDLMFAGSGETRDEIGKCVAYVGPTPAVAGGDVIVLRGERCNSVYLALLANSPEVARQKARAGQGDAVVHLYSSALAAIEVSLPPREEQDAIATVIMDVDSEFGVLQRRLVKARHIKLGMMQALLTGRTRLPVKEAVA
jgi:type I restriction enzyme S subunit